MDPSAYKVIRDANMNDMTASREQEKKDMQDLNKRLASYIEEVGRLKAKNRPLADELNKLKQNLGKETKTIKAMYQTELDEARKQKGDVEEENVKLQLKCTTLEEKLEDLQSKWVQPFLLYFTLYYEHFS